MSSYSEVQGKLFGRLKVESLTRVDVQHKRKRTRAYAVVVCDCGVRKTVSVDDLTSGKTKSCGCLRRDTSRDRARPLAEKFWEKVNKDGPIPAYRLDFDPCWIWTAAVNAKGYGVMGVKKGSTLAHVISYNLHVGHVPSGMQIDHLCRVRNCVNPNHLEVVTPRVNVNRGFGPTAIHARKTHCPKGHPYSGENLYLYIGGIHKGNRQCRICGRDRQRAYQKRKKTK